MFMDQGLGLEVLKPLVDKIEGAVNELGSLFRRHGGKCKGEMGDEGDLGLGMELGRLGMKLNICKF